MSIDMKNGMNFIDAVAMWDLMWDELDTYTLYMEKNPQQSLYNSWFNPLNATGANMHQNPM